MKSSFERRCHGAGRLRSSHARRGFLETAAARQTRALSLGPFSTVGGNGSDPILTQLDPKRALLQLLPFLWKRMISTGLLEAPGSVRAQIFAHRAMLESTLGIFPNEIKKP